MVSFDAGLRARLELLSKEKAPVAISDGAVKAADAGFEVIASPKRSNVTKSTKTFDLSMDLRAIDPDACELVNVDELQDLSVNQLVIVKVEIVSVSAPKSLQPKGTWKELIKQECVAGDATGSCRVVLWQTDVSKLEEDKSHYSHIIVWRRFRSGHLMVSSISLCRSGQPSA